MLLRVSGGGEQGKHSQLNRKRRLGIGGIPEERKNIHITAANVD